MKVEWLIAFYLFISVMMIFFNFGFLAYERVHAKRFEKKTVRIAEMLGHEIECNADFPTEEHKRTLERAMRRLAGMESFDLTMDRLQQLDAAKSDRYLRGITTVFDHLTYRFSKKDDLRRAYFAYVLKRWYRQRPASETVIQALLHYVREGSFYARQNAFEALAQVASAHEFAHAVELVARADDFHHPKLITETTLAFKGDADGLVRELTGRFDRLSDSARASVVNYLRMSGAGDRDRICAMLEDEQEDLEVRLACIRYFMRNYYEPAEGVLCRLAELDDPAHWEYATVATAALATYPSMTAFAVLKRCLSSPSWFVRHNAAKTLHGYGLSLGDLHDVMSGSDTYARDMLRYRWELEEVTGS